MLKQSARILVILLALYGLIQLTSLIFPGLKSFFKNSKVTNTPMIKGAIDYVNQILPASNQIQIPESSPNSNQDPKNITDTITNTVTEKITQVTADTFKSVKDSTQEQVCKALFAKLETECQE